MLQMIIRKSVLFIFLLYIMVVTSENEPRRNSIRKGEYFTKDVIKSYREKVRKMFYHAYDGYLNHAYPLDELKPISCTGQDTWGSFSLSLVDALDTLLVMGNVTEFRRAVELVLKKVRSDENVNVSVFETNIRVVGGLLSAHMLAGRHKEIVKEWPGWPCDGPLLKLAVEMADRLMPAFNSETGMPYGTVNLRYGVHKDETPITCTAGTGTYIIEFGTLSRLTGDEKYERVALKALDALWATRSPIGLVGNHINVQTGQWTAVDSGIGAGVDSYFEYLVKGAYLFRRPSLMKQFEEHLTAINKHVRKGDWFMWVSMTKATVSMPIFQSLEAFWPGTLSMTGDLQDAQRIMLQYSELIRQYGFPPEFYNIHNGEPVDKRAAFPLRPEMVESLMYLYRATKDTIWLEIGAEMVDAIESSAKTKCGYATINNVKEHNIEDRMESFFLAETTKYLYLLFDPSNFIHNDGQHSRIFRSSKNLTCTLFAGGYIFNTEAHPIDPGMLDCCSVQATKEQQNLKEFERKLDIIDLNTIERLSSEKQRKLKKSDLTDDLDKERQITEKGGELYFQNQYGKGNEGVEYEVDPKFQEESKRRAAERSQQVVKAEKNEKNSEYAWQKLRNLLMKTHISDEKTRNNGGKGNNAQILINQLHKLYPNLTAQIDEINDAAINDSMEYERNEFNKEIVRSMRSPKVYCHECCYLLDNEEESSVVFQSMMAEIFGSHVYRSRGISFVNGPICWDTEKPKIEDSYKNEPPVVSSSKWNIGHFENENMDATDFLDFDPKEVEHLGFAHLLSPSLSFSDIFTAGGHVALKRKLP